MNKTVRILLFGTLTWLVPFIVGMFFYSREGQLNTDIFLFKSIMIVISSVLGLYLMTVCFKKIESGFVREGMVIGVSWLAINYVLDFVVLLPMSGMSISTWFIQLGLRYLIIPAMSIAMGSILQYHKAK